MAQTVPRTLEEKLKNWLIPPKRYIAHRARKELQRGERELGLLPFVVDPNRVALDVGANKGVWTWWLAGLARQVYAYEPNPKLFDILRRNVAANVVAEQLALADYTGMAELRVPRSAKGYSNQGASLSEIKVDGDFLGVEVKAQRIDDLGITDIGFIKIDVEGFEKDVIDGLRRFLERCRPVLWI